MRSLFCFVVSVVVALLGTAGIVVYPASVSRHHVPAPEIRLTAGSAIDASNVLTAPQMAAWNVFSAAFTGDAATISTALQAGAHSVGSATIELPGSAVTDTINAVQAIGADLAAGESLIDAFNAAILGLVS